MIEDEDRAAGPRARPEGTPPPAANDNGNGDTSVRIDAAVLTIARLIRAWEALGPTGNSRH
jgi:hypothetical protein